MTAAKPKFFIANNHTNRIGHRKLSWFEELNPHMFKLSHSAHETWESAHAWLIEQCNARCEQTRKDFANAERRLMHAKAITKPEAA